MHLSFATLPPLARLQLHPEVWGPQDRASQRAAGQALRAQLGRVPLSESLAGPAVYAWAQGILAAADAPLDERQAPAAVDAPLDERQAPAGEASMHGWGRMRG
eukprot:1161412-Pelagomonas_calceolata.AAC.1